MSKGRFGSAERYEDASRAHAYAARSPKRDSAEARLLGDLLDGIEGGLGKTLDAPCGVARLEPLLVGRGARWIGLDASASMLARARVQDVGSPLVLGSLDRLPFSDRCFDTVCCFRFLHHLPPPQQEVALAELARVTRRRLIVSGFHPASAHGVWRRIEARLRRRSPARHSSAPRRVDAFLAREGMLAGTRRRQGLFRELWAGLWFRAEIPSRGGGRKGHAQALSPS